MSTPSTRPQTARDSWPPPTESRHLAATSGDLAARAMRCASVLAKFADEVDRDARFPHESVDALREAELLSSAVPVAYGGEGAGLDEVAEICRILGRECASTAMIFAVHQTHVYALNAHGRSEFLTGLLQRITDQQLLLTTAYTDSAIWSMSAPFELSDRGMGPTLTKSAAVIPFGEYADVLFVAARRPGTTTESDELLVAFERSSSRLVKTGHRDTSGLRGLCNHDFQLTAVGPDEATFADSFPDIVGQTLWPTWCSLSAAVSLGVADAVVARAEGYVQSTERPDRLSGVDTRPRLSELRQVHHSFDDVMHANTDAVFSQPHRTGRETGTAAQLIDIAYRAMDICGPVGYRRDGKFSIERLLRDASGVSLCTGRITA